MPGRSSLPVASTDATCLRPLGYTAGMMTLAEVVDPERWDGLVQALPHGHPLQLWAWGEVKRLNGWAPHRLVLLRAGTPVAAGQFLLWRLPAWERTIAYLPRGPLGSRMEAGAFLRAAAFARDHGALCLRIEPAWLDQPPPLPWRPADDRILLSHTYTIDLSRDEEALWAALRGKTRQYIRKAEGAGVVVERAVGEASLRDVCRIYGATATRAGFALHAEGYYRRVLAALGTHTRLYCAYIEGQAEAFLWVVQGGDIAFELYGGATERGAARKANYALKWRAIAEARRDGCALYDLNGRLSAGIDQFKAGFGVQETDYLGTYDLPLRRAAYATWRAVWPLAKPLGRALLRRHR